MGISYANNILVTAAAIFSALYFKLFADIESGRIIILNSN